MSSLPEDNWILIFMMYLLWHNIKEQGVPGNIYSAFIGESKYKEISS